MDGFHSIKNKNKIHSFQIKNLLKQVKILKFISILRFKDVNNFKYNSSYKYKK